MTDADMQRVVRRFESLVWAHLPEHLHITSRYMAPFGDGPWVGLWRFRVQDDTKPERYSQFYLSEQTFLSFTAAGLEAAAAYWAKGIHAASRTNIRPSAHPWPTGEDP